MIKAVLLCLFALGLSACILDTTDPQLHTRPNILVFLVDDLRWDALGASGHPFATTPNIDRLAAEGTMFREAFVVHSLCAPSRATFLTGRYPHSHGVVDNADRLDHHIPNIATLLDRRGYKTAFVGKWHLGSPSVEGLFDRWLTFKDQGEYMDPEVDRDGLFGRLEGHVTDVLTDYAVDFLGESHDAPFFLIVSHKAVHAPFIPQARFDGLHSASEITLPTTFSEQTDDKPDFLEARAISDDSTALRARIRRYHDTLAGVDESLGRIVSQLDEQRLLDNTLIIFVSDNGYLFGEHRLTDKRVAYEESIRIPLIARYPRWFATGFVSDAIALNLDIAPTVLDAAGIERSYGMEGKSLRALASHPRVSFLYEYFKDSRFPEVPSIRAIRTRDFKYITYIDADETDELYDLRKDPIEGINLAGDPDYASELQSLRAQLHRLRISTGDIEVGSGLR